MNVTTPIPDENRITKFNDERSARASLPAGFKPKLVVYVDANGCVHSSVPSEERN